MGDLVTIPARRGKAARIAKGKTIKVINTHGTQVVDSWAFNHDEPWEFMSMEHMRVASGSIFPKVGDALVTNRRRPILTLLEDTSPGIHDTLMAACDKYRYQLLGCGDDHENCTDNLHLALMEIAFTAQETPAPLNLWMNIPVNVDGGLDFLPPVSRPGDYVVFRADMDAVVVFSACPQDQVPVNGADCIPVEAHFEIL
ncbi:MAG: urea carboxylase-associated family protein [Alphaproteobacteria bacterium]|nr:urea carboxylase-associated family protein [Alphaproteobacteria bacterium]